ncbi:hypothetical protein PUP75_11445 [Pseudomonas chlororaphis]|uniref:hypothetical protein n=1 Tax=Pseudomonas chlororaphis TaxID=587753 RepID=UPI00236774F8|nr:hypothetical protein [Pseudomonas chlororaphis]WDH55368.1 hypothetical protein PUP75_11445 [Pseudomonas chlororaphis]
METPEQREIKKVVNSHASDIQALTAIVFGLAAQLYESQGEAGLAAAEARTMTVSKSMGSAFGVRPNSNLINQVFKTSRQPS